MSDTVLDLNPHFNGKKGISHNSLCIVGGLFIEGKEGMQWFENITGMKLAEDHSEDISVVSSLRHRIKEHGLTQSCRVYLIDPCTARCHITDGHPIDPRAWDFLVITYIECRPFYHDGVGGCNYIVNEERKLHPGVKEAKLKEQLKELFGVEATGYKSQYCDLFYSWLVCY